MSTIQINYKNTSINYKQDILKSFILKPDTIYKYTKSLSSFLRYIQIHFPHSSIFSYSLTSSTSTILTNQLISELDRLLCNYMNYLYITNGKHYKASNAFNSIIFYLPQCKNQLFESHQRLRGWDRINLTNKIYKIPFTLELSYVLALSLIKGGFVYHAIGVLLAFECYLRISELCNLRICDIGIPTDNLNMVIGLANTKTGPNQSVLVRDPFISSLVLLILKDKNQLSKNKLFPFNEKRFRDIFKSGCTILGLNEYNFTPHCLRHGGCTHDYVIKNIGINDIMSRGRWSQHKSIKTYIHSLQYLHIHVKEKRLTLLGKNIICQSKSLFQFANSKLQQ